MNPSDIVSYMDLCLRENCSLQRGMNYKLRGGHSVILMSVREGAPYNDVMSDDGRSLIYEGHDINNIKGGPNPKMIDQPRYINIKNTRHTQNGLFEKSVIDYKNKSKTAELVRVYEKIKPGIWVFNGDFNLIDCTYVLSGSRKVFKFTLQMTDENRISSNNVQLDHDRIIPSHVKQAVWKRDNGQCISCGSAKNLHFDHIIPYSKGGSSKVVENIQLLCAIHNLEKSAKII